MTAPDSPGTCATAYLNLHFEYGRQQYAWKKHGCVGVHDQARSRQRHRCNQWPQSWHMEVSTKARACFCMLCKGCSPSKWRGQPQPQHVPLLVCLCIVLICLPASCKSSHIGCSTANQHHCTARRRLAAGQRCSWQWQMAACIAVNGCLVHGMHSRNG